MAVSERLMGGISPHKAPQLKHVLDAALNDSDKTFTVPATKIWHLLLVGYTFTATATVGNRSVTIRIRDDADATLFETRQSTNHTASEVRTGTAFTGFGSVPGILSVIEYAPLPSQLFLPAGFDIRVFDSNAIDAAADDLDVQIMVMEYVQS